MVTYDRFITFLTEKKCKKAFNDAFFHQHPGYHLDSTLWDILGGDEYIIGRAFDWEKTTQGREYWLTLDREWCKLVRTNNC